MYVAPKHLEIYCSFILDRFIWILVKKGYAPYFLKDFFYTFSCLYYRSRKNCKPYSKGSCDGGLSDLIIFLTALAAAVFLLNQATPENVFFKQKVSNFCPNMFFFGRIFIFWGRQAITNQNGKRRKRRNFNWEIFPTG